MHGMRNIHTYILYKSLKTLRTGDDILYPNKSPFHDNGFVRRNILYTLTNRLCTCHTYIIYHTS